MKYLYSIIPALILFTCMTTAANAVDAAKSEAMPMKAMGMHHGMGGMMENMTEEQKDKHLQGMQEHMLKMHDLSNRILAEKDASKKEQLKTEQLQLMKTHHSEMMMHHQQMQQPLKK